MASGPTAVVALVLLLTCATLTSCYYVRYLNVTATTLLSNQRLLTQYVRCFVGDGPCTPQAKEIKKLFPELMSSSCSQCDLKLRQVFESCMKLLEIHYPSEISKFLPNLEQNTI